MVSQFSSLHGASQTQLPFTSTPLSEHGGTGGGDGNGGGVGLGDGGQGGGDGGRGGGGLAVPGEVRDEIGGGAETFGIVKKFTIPVTTSLFPGQHVGFVKAVCQLGSLSRGCNLHETVDAKYRRETCHRAHSDK